MRAGLFPTALASSVILVSQLNADVTSWRNGGTGLYPDVTPEMDWEASAAWVAKTKARSNGSPVLVGDKLIVPAEPATLICLDAKSGKVLWEKGNDFADLAGKVRSKDAVEASEELDEVQRELYRAERRLKRNRGDAALKEEVKELKDRQAELLKKAGTDGMEKPKTNGSNGYTSYTPVSDGKKVWACFGIGVVVCYDLDGKRLWFSKLESPDHNWGGACSPVLADGRLVVRFEDYHGLDPETGEELWRSPSEGVTFNGPTTIELEGKTFVVTPRGEVFRAEDGEKVWSAKYEVTAKPWCFVNTPVVQGKNIYFAHGSEGQQGDAYCVEIPQTVSELEKDGLKQIWYKEVSKNRYYSSPLVVDGVVYLINRDYLIMGLDAKTGEALFEEKVKGMAGTAYPSLTLAGDMIFVGSEEGTVVFLKPGRKYEELGRTEVEPFRSSPVFAGDFGFLRTQESVRAVKAR